MRPRVLIPACTLTMIVQTGAIPLPAGAQQSPVTVPSIPLVRGLTIVSALHFPDGDRENVVAVEDSTADGVTYSWHFRERRKDGSVDSARITRFVRAADLAAAARLNTFFDSRNPSTPGFTSLSISTATYDKVSAGAATPFANMALDDSSEPGRLLGQLRGMFASLLVMRGTLERVSPLPQPMPLIVDGRRVVVPALQLKGRFRFQDRQEGLDIWVLADRAHPMLLRTVFGADVLQVVRVELPGAVAALEQTLASECAGELTGVHFAFGSAEIESSSARALAAVAQSLERHRDWTLSIEGHTDSIGSAAANVQLSRRRADAVRNALIAHHHVRPARLSAGGYGAERPRESNATLEGRARNRRVELVRPCPARTR